MKRWSLEEDNILLENYNKIPFKEVMTLLPNRTENGIQWRAVFLGITNKRNKSWSKQEMDLIKSDLPLSEVATRTGRTYLAVNKKRALERDKMRNLHKVSKLTDVFDLSVIQKKIPIINPLSKSSNHFALLMSLKVGDSYEFPCNEVQILRNQIQRIPNRKFETKSWSKTTKRVWRIL